MHLHQAPWRVSLEREDGQHPVCRRALVCLTDLLSQKDKRELPLQAGPAGTPAEELGGSAVSVRVPQKQAVGPGLMQDLWLEGEGDAHPLCRLSHGLGDKTALVLEHTVPTGCVSQAALVASAPCQPSLPLETCPKEQRSLPGVCWAARMRRACRRSRWALHMLVTLQPLLCPPTSRLPARGADLSLA